MPLASLLRPTAFLIVTLVVAAGLRPAGAWEVEEDPGPPSYRLPAVAGALSIEQDVWLAVGETLYMVEPNPDEPFDARRPSRRFQTGHYEGIGEVFLDFATGNLITYGKRGGTVRSFSTVLDGERAWETNLPENVRRVTAHSQALDAGLLALLAIEDRGGHGTGRAVFLLDARSGEVVDRIRIDSRDTADRRFSISADGRSFAVSIVSSEGSVDGWRIARWNAGPAGDWTPRWLTAAYDPEAPLSTRSHYIGTFGFRGNELLYLSEYYTGEHTLHVSSRPEGGIIQLGRCRLTLETLASVRSSEGGQLWTTTWATLHVENIWTNFGPATPLMCYSILPSVENPPRIGGLNRILTGGTFSPTGDFLVADRLHGMDPGNPPHLQGDGGPRAASNWRYAFDRTESMVLYGGSFWRVVAFQPDMPEDFHLFALEITIQPEDVAAMILGLELDVPLGTFDMNGDTMTDAADLLAFTGP